jgi:hypothetical protein
VRPFLQRLAGQAFALATFFALIGYASTRPAYTHRDPADAQIVVAFSHSGARVAECRRLSPEEIAALAPNMRRATDCPRGRVPLHFVLELDGERVIDAVVHPAGIANDGRASQYARFAVPTGPRRITARLRDSRGESGYDWEQSIETELAPRQSFSIDFRPEVGGFVFR